jgi:hypothetical protein
VASALVICLRPTPLEFSWSSGSGVTFVTPAFQPDSCKQTTSAHRLPIQSWAFRHCRAGSMELRLGRILSGHFSGNIYGLFCKPVMLRVGCHAAAFQTGKDALIDSDAIPALL